MKVILISPAVHSVLQKTNTIMPPLGLLHVASVLREAGHDVQVVDMSLNATTPDLSPYDLVGITCTTSQTWKALDYGRQAKELGKTVVMGGPHPSFMADSLFATGLVDYVVRGEGEYTALDLVNGLEQHKGQFNPATIQGLSWYDKETKRAVHNPPRPFIKDLDSLPDPARDLLDLESYKVTKYQGRSTITILTSRGCPYDCSFCASTQLTGKKWRKRSVIPIVDEIEFLAEKHGFTAVAFVDDNLTIHIPRAKELCDEIIRRRLDIRWWCMASADSLIRNEELIEKMAAAGCGQVFIGLESPNERVLTSYNKKASADMGRKSVEILRKYGIGAYGSFILGEVSETVEDINRTIKYAKSLNLKTAQFSLLTPYPGTRLFSQMENRLITKDWRKFDGLHAVFQPDFLTPKKLDRLLIKAYLSFYLDRHRLSTKSLLYQLRKALTIIKGIKSN
ncbi:MAG: radical SAM protein [Thermodesulfobacteriota bacterium]